MAEAEVLGHWALLAKLTLEDSSDGPLSKPTEETLMEVRAPVNSAGLLTQYGRMDLILLCVRILCDPHKLATHIGFTCITWHLQAVGYPFFGPK